MGQYPVRINIFGLALPKNEATDALRDLSIIAEASGGKYYPVPYVHELNRTIAQSLSP